MSLNNAFHCQKEQVAKTKILMDNQVGGCHVPGLNVGPDPVGSEDLKQDYKHRIINQVINYK